MPQILEDITDIAAEDMDLTLSLEEEHAVAALGEYQDYKGGDLTDGGAVGGAHIFPSQNGVKQEKGRPAARRAWMYDGTETVLPLAWNPDGTAHDFARRYMRKRHCECCGHNGVFRRNQCNDCVFNNCTKCRDSTDPTKIIPCFYLNREDVPYPQKFYGSIPCFLPLCPRGGEYGFLTSEDMRVHARSRHQMEYQAHMETIAANKTDEMDELRTQIKQINMLLADRLSTPVQETSVVLEPDFTITVDDSPAKRERTPEQKEADRARMAKVRAARKPT